VVVLASVLIRNQSIVRLIVVGNRSNTCNSFSNIFYARELAYKRLLYFSLNSLSPYLEKEWFLGPDLSQSLHYASLGIRDIGTLTVQVPGLRVREPDSSLIVAQSMMFQT
jgi:hypothetical protein